MIWLPYNVLFALGLAAALPYYALRMSRRGGYRRGFAQRLGVYGHGLRRKIGERRRIWVHAVSVGEVAVALRFMDAFRERAPGTAFVLSTNTSTAHAVAQRRLHAADVLIYFPVDLPPVVWASIRAIRPQMLILTEGELWPNLIRALSARGVPVVLINGRMSESSFRGYRRLRPVFSRVLRMLDTLCVQSREDADRMVAVGADPSAVHVTGSAKYDAAIADPECAAKARAVLAQAGMRPGDTFLVGGSTWAGEEAILLDIYLRLRCDHPALKLVLVPRHAERRDEVMGEIRSRNVRAVQRSRMTAAPPDADSPDVLLVDTTGELAHFLAAGSVIFMGKSLTAHGGQNFIEPAAYGKPVVVGPNVENFIPVARDFLAADAIVQVPDAASLEKRLGELLSNEALRQALGERAAAVVRRERGSIERTLRVVEAIAARSAASSATRSY